MATVIRASTGDSLKFVSGTPISWVFEAVQERFGKCLHKRPRLARIDGSIVYDLDGTLPDGEYTYETAPTQVVPPSSFDYNAVKEKQMVPDPEFLYFLPATAVPPVPLQLLFPGFGRFVDNVRGGGSLPQPTESDYRHYVALASACSSFYDEEGPLREQLRKAWRAYLGMPVLDELFTGACNTGGRSATDLGIRESESEALIFLEEVKRGASTSYTEPLMQALMNLKLNWFSARVGEKELLSDTCFPALVLQHVGQLLQVGCVVILPNEYEHKQDKVCYQPLTSVEIVPIHNHDRSMAMQGVRTCMAIKATVQELIAYYRSAAAASRMAGPDPEIRALLRKRIPHPLQLEALEADVRRLGEKLVYVVNKPDGQHSVVKYCQLYGAEVHLAWGRADFAPKLLSVENLPGGWIEVRMEWLAPDEGWKVLCDVEEADALRDRVVQVLKAAHKVQVRDGGEPTYGVHGDMRDSNVMVRASNGQLDVRFIDFDWAKEEGLAGACYPAFMNHAEINWPQGVQGGKPMLQKHDLNLLQLKQALQTKQTMARGPNMMRREMLKRKH